MASDKREYTFAQTFPTGTHAMWLYYWLAAHGIDPMRDAKAITVPPPQMVANMRVGNMDGFCVGEPRARDHGQDRLHRHHDAGHLGRPSRKVLGASAEFVARHPNTARAVTAAVLEAGKWIDASEANRQKTAETIAAKSYVNTDAGGIVGRMQAATRTAWASPGAIRMPCAFMPMARPTSLP